MTGDAPLHELGRDALSAFLYAALLPEEVLGLVKQLGLTSPGFRPEKLGEVERCDLLADEIRAAPETRLPVLAALGKALKEPAFATSTLDPAAADELLEVAGSDHGLAIALWRLLADPERAVRARGEAALEKLAADWYGPSPAREAGSEAATASEAEGGPAAPGAAAPGRDPAAGRVQSLEAKLAKAEERADEAQARADAARDKLQAQLREARGAEAHAVDDAARAREASEAARRALERSEAALEAARATDAAAEAQRLRGQVRDLETRLHAAEGRATRGLEQVAALQAAAEEARREVPAAQPGGAPAAAAEADVEDAPATWLLPVFTQEFYASLDGWDRRIQRAAVKQAYLLAQDHRHPSLRALPLEGIPGYYRVRVATDVRLIYRRSDKRQDEVEILSVIDREDLDRYVRQAKTR